MKEEIKLGDMVKDNVSGYEGIAVARTKFLNGCIQYTVASKAKDNKISLEGEPSIDELNLKVVKKNVVNSSEYVEEEKVLDEDIKKVNAPKIKGGPTQKAVGFKGW